MTTLKRVCRAGNMQRWPFRKRNSLGRLIDRTKQVLDDGTGQDNMQKLAALQVLEKQRQVMRVHFSSCLSYTCWHLWPLLVGACLCCGCKHILIRLPYFASAPSLSANCINTRHAALFIFVSCH